MKCIQKARRVVLAAMAASLLAFAPVAGAGPTLPSEAELTAQWWQWVYSIPANENPLLDETGEDAGNGQPFRGVQVFFLGGVDNVSGTAERTITLPAATALFFPIVNIEWDNIGVPPTSPNYLTVPELYDFAASMMDSVTDLHVTLNRVSLLDDVERVQSPPFAYRLPEGNIYQALGIIDFVGTVAPAVSDGYWLYVPPLARGTYTLNFGGTVQAADFTLDITYHITVE